MRSRSEEQGGGTTVSFALTLRVPKDDWDATYTETKMLWEYAKEKNVGSNVELFLRGAFEKVNASMAAVNEKRQKDAEEAAKASTEPKKSYFTEEYKVKDGAPKGSQVRPLKGSAASTKNNIKTYTLQELGKKIVAKQLDLTTPFLVKGGVTALAKLQAKWSSDYLIENMTKHTLRYFTPADAKAKRTFDTQEEQQKAQEEQYKPHLISFEKYFKNCFNYRAKPDFKKFGGVGTEHCEQFVKVADLDPNMSETYTLEGFAALSWLTDINKAKQSFLSKVFPASGGDPKLQVRAELLPCMHACRA